MEKLTKLNYVDQAENVIKKLKNETKEIFDKRTRQTKKVNYKMPTSNKMRTILAIMNELYEMVRTNTTPELSEDIQSRVQYAKMKLAYEAGRDEKNEGIKDFINLSELMTELGKVGKSREQLLIVCHYTEALIAYHKFYSNN